MNRSVMMRPGSTRFTVTPSLATSPARVLNIPAMAGRMPLERTRPSTGCLTELDWMARIRPHFFRFMSGSTARMKRTVDRCTCSKAAFHCSSVIWSNGPGGGPPTLATRTSTPPQRAEAAPCRGNAADIGGDDDIAYPQARQRAGAVGHEPRHDHAFVGGVGEDPDPRPLRAADRPPVAQILGPVLLEALAGN